MKFENKGKWLKEAEEKDNLVFDERTKMDFNEEDEEINGELAAEVESDEFIDELDRPEEEEDAIELSEGCHKNEANEDFIKDVKVIIDYANKTYKDMAKASPTTKYDPSFNAIKDFSMNDMDDGSYMVKFGSGNINTALLDKAMRKAITNAKVSKKRSLGNIGTKMFIYESSQKNEGGIARIRKLGQKSVWKGPMYKENEYMVVLYKTDLDFKRGTAYFSNPKGRSLPKQDAINYVKEKWPGYKIVIQESSQKNEGKTIDDISTRELGKCLKEYRNKVGNNKILQNSTMEIANEFQRYFGLSKKPSFNQIKEILDNMPKDYLESSQKNEANGAALLRDMKDFKKWMDTQHKNHPGYYKERKDAINIVIDLLEELYV